MVKNKKAQGMSINTVVLLILAVIVLVVIIAGFTMGWGNMWERVQGFFSKTNVDSIASTCNIQCTTNQEHEFCKVQKTLRIEQSIFSECNEKGDNLPCCISKGTKIVTCKGTCKDFLGKITGLDSCSIECP